MKISDFLLLTASMNLPDDIFYTGREMRSKHRKEGESIQLEKRKQFLEKQLQSRQLHKFTIKGKTVMAYSRKDAIKRLNNKI